MKISKNCSLWLLHKVDQTSSCMEYSCPLIKTSFYDIKLFVRHHNFLSVLATPFTPWITSQSHLASIFRSSENWAPLWRQMYSELRSLVWKLFLAPPEVMSVILQHRGRRIDCRVPRFCQMAFNFCSVLGCECEERDASRRPTTKESPWQPRRVSTHGWLISPATTHTLSFAPAAWQT